MNRQRRYPRDYDAAYPAVAPGPGWYPGVFAGAAPMWGWGAWWPPYAPVGFGAYDRDVTPRRPPRESETYGRGGDRAVRRYARSHGYDDGYTIRPHPGRGRRRGYDARFGRRG